jgi:integrase
MAKTKVKPGWVGPLYQAKDGKRPWVCDYGDWATGNKKRHKCGVAGKKKDAEAEWIKFRQSMENKTHTPNSTRTFGDALDEYEKWSQGRRQLKQIGGSHLNKISLWIKNHIRPALGHVRLTEIDTIMIESFINDLARRYKAVHVDIAVMIKETLDRAVYLDWLAISPLQRKKMAVPPRPRAETSIPTIEQGRALWLSISERGYWDRAQTHVNRVAAVALAMFGGCEKGVVAGLCWEDVDWVGGVINICRSWSRHDGLKDPKNRFRIRSIPMSAEIQWSLRAIWERESRPSVGYVFNTIGIGGTRYGLYSGIYQVYLARAMLRAGFVDERGKPLWTYHELRHYAGSIWLEAGASIQDVSRMLGHSNIGTTQKFYIKFFKKQEAERHRLIADKVSAMHQFPALPKPMREICEISAEDIEIVG